VTGIDVVAATDVITAEEVIVVLTEVTAVEEDAEGKTLPGVPVAPETGLCPAVLIWPIEPPAMPDQTAGPGAT